TCLSVYVFVLAPEMSEQLPPFSSQRRHWYEYVIGAVPLHSPGSAVSVEPTCGVPEIVGGEVLAGDPGAAFVAAKPNVVDSPSATTTPATIAVGSATSVIRLIPPPSRSVGSRW